MLRVARFACFIVLLVLVSGSSCGDEPPRSRDRTPSTSATATPTTTATDSVTPSDSSVATTVPPSSTTTARLSGIATRTGYTIIRDGQPIDAAGLAALGWTVDADTGDASWSDASLGEYSVTWEIPDQRAIAFFDVSFWGSVTGHNLAINPSMYTTVFTGGPVEATAHSVGGTKADTPTGRLRVEVPEQPAGTTASVSINLGFPQPVLITYNYRYE